MKEMHPDLVQGFLAPPSQSTHSPVHALTVALDQLTKGQGVLSFVVTTVQSSPVTFTAELRINFTRAGLDFPSIVIPGLPATSKARAKNASAITALPLLQRLFDPAWTPPASPSPTAPMYHFPDSTLPGPCPEKTTKKTQHGKTPKGGRTEGSTKKRQKSLKAPPTTGPTGRLIMTEDRWHNDDFVATLNLRTTGHLNHPNNILSNITKEKLRYKQDVSRAFFGGKQKVHMATTTTTFDKGVIANGTTELVCSGLGRTKKLAEFYAAVDLIAALKTCGIDARNPPDMKAMQQEQEKEQLKLKVNKAQMILELLGSSRPQFEFDQRANKWQAEASLRVCGTNLTVTGPTGNTKTQAEGLALMKIVNGTDLSDFLVETR
jgi:hypothetical protein